MKENDGVPSDPNIFHRIFHRTRRDSPSYSLRQIYRDSFQIKWFELTGEWLSDSDVIRIGWI